MARGRPRSRLCLLTHTGCAPCPSPGPAGAEFSRGHPPGGCEGSHCIYLSESSVPWSPGDRYLGSLQQPSGVGVLSPLCRRGHGSGRVAFGPWPLPPWPCVCARVWSAACPGRWLVSQPRRGCRLRGGWSSCRWPRLSRLSLGGGQNHFCLRLPVFFRQHVRP